MIVKWATWGFVLGRTTYHLAMRAARSASGSGRSAAPQPPSPSLPAVESKHSDEPPDSAPSADTADPLKFFLLVFGLTIPFYVFGGKPLSIPIELPASALMVFNPFLAAAILSFRNNGRKGIQALVNRAFDVRRIRRRGWLALAFLLVPVIYLLAYGIMRLTGAPLPEPEIPFQIAPLLFGLYLIPAAGEELGWMGYAVDPLQKRWGAFRAALIVGLVWSVWHAIPDLQIGHPVSWIFWQRLYTVALRVLIVWVYNNSNKSVFSAIVIHAADTMSWTLFPNFGSHYNPFYICLITSILAITVVAVWGPKTLTRLKVAGTASE